MSTVPLQEKILKISDLLFLSHQISFSFFNEWMPCAENRNLVLGRTPRHESRCSNGSSRNRNSQMNRSILILLKLCCRQGQRGCRKRLHNEFRSEVARGKARVHEVFLPPAQAMAKMVRYWYAGRSVRPFPYAFFLGSWKYRGMWGKVYWFDLSQARSELIKPFDQKMEEIGETAGLILLPAIATMLV